MDPLRVDFDVTADLGLTGQNVALSFVLIGERILDGHTHITGKELDSAGCARTRSAGIIDQDAGVIGDIQDGRVEGCRRDGIRSLKYDLTGNLGRLCAFSRAIACDRAERLRPNLALVYTEPKQGALD